LVAILERDSSTEASHAGPVHRPQRPLDARGAAQEAGRFAPWLDRAARAGPGNGAQEKAKFPSRIYTPEAEERALNRYTLHYYFDYRGYEVLYRSTPEGPDVLAVGLDEILAFEKRTAAEEQFDLNNWLP